MKPRKADLVELAAKIRMDLTAAQAKLTELKRAIAALPDDPDADPHPCPHCGLALTSLQRLQEHLWNVHAEGPLAPAPQTTDDAIPF